MSPLFTKYISSGFAGLEDCHSLDTDSVKTSACVIITAELLQLCPNVSTEDSQWCTQDFILGGYKINSVTYLPGRELVALAVLGIFGGYKYLIPLGYAPVSDDLQQVLYATPERGLSQLLVWLCVPQWRLFTVVWNWAPTYLAGCIVVSKVGASRRLWSCSCYSCVSFFVHQYGDHCLMVCEIQMLDPISAMGCECMCLLCVMLQKSTFAYWLAYWALIFFSFVIVNDFHVKINWAHYKNAINNVRKWLPSLSVSLLNVLFWTSLTVNEVVNFVACGL